LEYVDYLALALLVAAIVLLIVRRSRGADRVADDTPADVITK
jgi:hypothetical protein